jgi:thiol-disulfide isomerase/thioredoxin
MRALSLSFVLAALAVGCARAPADVAPSEPARFAFDGEGSELAGRDVSALLPTRFARGARRADAKATLVRFWTDTCPYCERSLPALEQLRGRYVDAGLDVIAIYHPKPPRAVNDAEVAAAAARIGFNGVVAVDEQWASLNAIWLDTGKRDATSASFLLDASGRIRFVHPGPEFHPSDDLQYADADRDYRKLDDAIAKLLAEKSDAR